LLEELNPSHSSVYEANYSKLVSTIDSIDSAARQLFADDKGRSFMIYHPNLAYLARDYGLHEVAVEFNGKEPPPSRMKYLIDLAAKDSLKAIFIQREFDTKNAREIARETGAELVIIDPLSEDWLKSTSYIINALKKSFN
jgi:zinc transport system substrate-binding protein